jgi:hypothetical protein
MEWEQPEEFSGDNQFLKTNGTYHLCVIDATELDKEGKTVDGVRVILEVLDGTPRNKDGCTEVGRQTTVTLWNGHNNKDGGKFARKVQAAFFVAAGVIGDPEVELIRNRQLRGVDLERARGSQIMATMKVGKSGYMDFDGTSIWHVDDESAQPFPRNTKALGMLPADRRSTPPKLQLIKDAFSGDKRESRQPVTAGVGDLDI